MKKVVIIGKANAGKTLFAINFGFYLGNAKLRIAATYPDGATVNQTYPPTKAREELTSEQPHQTRCLQRMTLGLPAGKGVKRFQIIDTSGLIEGIPPEAQIRRAIAQTLATVREADLILHLIDASRVKQEGAVEAIGEVDYQVAQFAQMRSGYGILANKMDLPTAAQGLEIIRREFVGHRIIPISALYREGFQEVKEFVWRHL
ncbi:MAG: GTPase [Limnochordia bacterium]|jgi:small GTP-binding protein